MAVMLENGLNWSAEIDQAEYPYNIYKKAGKILVRFPIITLGDYHYISKKMTADEMYEALILSATHIQEKKIFGAIGFHPWVNGEEGSRIHTMERFFKYLSRMPALKIVTFNEAYNLIVAHDDGRKHEV